jgi:hypothetical protein
MLNRNKKRFQWALETFSPSKREMKPRFEDTDWAFGLSMISTFFLYSEKFFSRPVWVGIQLLRSTSH